MSREQDLARLAESWDLVVVGGGVSGAGVFSLAVAQGYKCLLLDAHDFAWGASSRSSKLVHGGLRYMRQGQVLTTWHSVRERQRLLKRYPGLIKPMGFLFPLHTEGLYNRAVLGAGLSIYDRMAGRREHRYHQPGEFAWLDPQLADSRPVSGFSFSDAVTDDARLVLRLIHEGERRGGLALNYLEAVELLLAGDGQVRGVVVRDSEVGAEMEVPARVVVNATGPWCDRLRQGLGGRPRLRPLKGSHLIFPHWRFPLAQAICCLLPADGRVLFALPWQGVTLVGTTDLDCELELGSEPAISPEEGDYLLEGLGRWFPSLGLGTQDVQTTSAGLRPVVASNQGAPSCQSRAHSLWSERGLISLAGGKLTTFDLMARQALKAVRAVVVPIGSRDHAPRQPRQLIAGGLGLPRAVVADVMGRHGPASSDLLPVIARQGAETVPGTDLTWAELPWLAAREKVVHLDDLLLRRTRLGLTLSQGGECILAELEPRLRPGLGWSPEHWRGEVKRYMEIWRRAYSPRLIQRPDKEK